MIRPLPFARLETAQNDSLCDLLMSGIQFINYPDNLLSGMMHHIEPSPF
jgi:hypothetical protein